MFITTIIIITFIINVNCFSYYYLSKPLLYHYYNYVFSLTNVSDYIVIMRHFMERTF